TIGHELQEIAVEGNRHVDRITDGQAGWGVIKSEDVRVMLAVGRGDVGFVEAAVGEDGRVWADILGQHAAGAAFDVDGEAAVAVGGVEELAVNQRATGLAVQLVVRDLANTIGEELEGGRVPEVHRGPVLDSLKLRSRVGRWQGGQLGGRLGGRELEGL